LDIVHWVSAVSVAQELLNIPQRASFLRSFFGGGMSYFSIFVLALGVVVDVVCYFFFAATKLFRGTLVGMVQMELAIY